MENIYYKTDPSKTVVQLFKKKKKRTRRRRRRRKDRDQPVMRLPSLKTIKGMQVEGHESVSVCLGNSGR